MKIKLLVILSLLSFALISESCKKVKGCTDSNSINYNPDAEKNDGSCILKVHGCMDSDGDNYNPQANVDDGSCVYTGDGNAMFWKSGGANVYVIMYSGPYGELTNNYAIEPGCNQSGCYTFTGAPGDYAYYYYYNNNSQLFQGSVNIKSKKCTKVHIN